MAFQAAVTVGGRDVVVEADDATAAARALGVDPAVVLRCGAVLDRPLLAATAAGDLTAHWR